MNFNFPCSTSKLERAKKNEHENWYTEYRKQFVLISSVWIEVWLLKSFHSRKSDTVKLNFDGSTQNARHASIHIIFAMASIL